MPSFKVVVDEKSGFITRYIVDGKELLESPLRPNFWRAPTDNDYGAGLQQKYKAWRNPEMKAEQSHRQARRRSL